MSEPRRIGKQGHETIEAAGRVVRDARDAERDEILAARRALRRSEKEHDHRVREAEHELGRVQAPDDGSTRDVGDARQELADAREDRLHVAEVAPLVHDLAERCADEQLLDLAPGVWTGHDGVLAVTDRRLLFVGLRESLDLRFDDIVSVSAKGRVGGSRLELETSSGRQRIAGLSRERAAELAELCADVCAGA